MLVAELCDSPDDQLSHRSLAWSTLRIQCSILTTFQIIPRSPLSNKQCIQSATQIIAQRGMPLKTLWQSYIQYPTPVFQLDHHLPYILLQLPYRVHKVMKCLSRIKFWWTLCSRSHNDDGASCIAYNYDFSPDTRPTFHFVPATQDISNAVITDQYPIAETRKGFWNVSPVWNTYAGPA